MEFEEAIKLIFDKKCILFTGAGFSLGATNISGENFNTSGILANEMDNLTDDNNNGNLGYAAESFEEIFGVDKLIDFIREHFEVKDVCDFHKIIGSQPWRRIYTTNYDNIHEYIIRHECKHEPESATLSTPIHEIVDKEGIKSKFISLAVSFIIFSFCNNFLSFRLVS